MFDDQEQEKEKSCLDCKYLQKKISDTEIA
jgi:hypothetical protein